MEFLRGITPETLLEHVRNTIPFALDARTPPESPYLKVVWEACRRPESSPPLSHHEYFALCVSAHLSTVSSFVPTDVDNQIRFKLWHPELSASERQTMVSLVTQALGWDMTAISKRFVRGPQSGRVLSGMHGEWFSIAVGAYCALRSHGGTSSTDADAMRGLILHEMQREAEVLGEFVQARDGIGALQAATSIAHNLGDLDRVMDQWNLDPADPLRAEAYRAGHDNPARFKGLLRLAGELNKLVLSATGMAPTSMAAENHRHFALRQARSLRRSPDLLLPISPFFDDWGATVGRHPLLSPEDVAEITQCLMDGWDKLKPIQKTAAYPRALAGIESSFSGGLSRLCQYLPAKSAKNLRSGLLRTLTSIRRDRFEAQWGEQALKLARGLLR